LIVTNTGYDNNNVLALLNNGFGQFSTKIYCYNLIHRPQSIVAGDYDGDQQLEIAVLMGELAQTVRFFEFDSSGNFLHFATSNVGRDPVHMVDGDFDGDGSLDLAAVSKGENKVSILLNSNPVNIDNPKNNIISDFRIFQNYPNPFNSETTIR